MSAIDINSTTFAKFCAATGPARLTVVRDAKHRYGEGYKQGPDYWKPFRDELVRVLRAGASPTELKGVLNSRHVRPEWEANYDKAISGAITWMGRKRIVLQPCRTVIWSSGDLHVKVRPEFAALINDELHVVKLWLKTADKLSKPRADAMLHLLDTTHGRRSQLGATAGVLDVMNAKLFKQTRSVRGVDTLLKSEATAFVEIWREL